MARPAKPVDLRTGHITKSELEQRKIVENAVRGEGHPTPPKHLSIEQKKLFKNIVDMLGDSGVLCKLDAFVLGNCAVAIDRIADYDRMINADPNLLADRDTIRNRDITVKEFFRCCNELGLSPQSRAKLGTISISKKAEEDDPLLVALQSRETNN